MKDYRIIVGNNNFPNCPGNDLRGCRSDAELVGETFFNCFGKPYFEGILLNCRKEVFIGWLRNAIESAKSNFTDRIIIWISTHGTVISDSDENNFVTGIVFSDVTPDGGGVLRDYDFKAMLDEIPDTCLVEIFLDLCHSGTAARGLVMASEIHNHRPRFIDLGHQPRIVEKAPLHRKAQDGTPNVIVWGACLDHETAADLDLGKGQFGGAFTTAWYETMAASNGKQTRREVFQEVTERLKLFNQTPTLSAQ